MGDGFRLHKKMGDNTAVEIIRRMNAETCCLVQQQGVVRHEEERAGIVMCRVVVPPELVALDLCDRLSVQVEHGFVMCLQRLAEPREVEHDDAICHGNRPPSSCPIRGGRCAGLPRLRSSFTPTTRPVDTRDRTNAAEVRLSVVYAELGGMIGDSHKSERRMLL